MKAPRIVPADQVPLLANMSVSQSVLPASLCVCSGQIAWAA